MRAILGNATILATLAILTGSSVAADNIPDFSGRWGRNAFNFEPLPNGPQPLTNLKRRADGTNDPLDLVGDYMNPILKPEAAANAGRHRRLWHSSGVRSHQR